MHSIKLTLHNSNLTISGHNKQLLQWIENCYISYSNPLSPEEKNHYTWQLEESGTPYEIPLALPTDGALTGFGLLDAPCQYKDGVLYVAPTELNPQSLLFEPANYRLQANLAASLLTCEETFIYNVMHEFLQKLIYPFNQWITIHAAAVKYADKTICLVGDKGAGKSTTTIKLLEESWGIISDDNPILRLNSGKVEALSSLDGLSVTEETLNLFPQLRQSIGRRREISGKYFLAKEYQQRAIQYGPETVSHIVLLRRGQYEFPRLVEWDKKELFRYLMQTTPMFLVAPSTTSTATDLFSANDSMFDTISALVTQAKLFALEYSDHHLDQVSKLLSGLPVITTVQRNASRQP